MRLRLKFVLPIVQMALASWLLWRANVWYLVEGHAIFGPSAPTFTLTLAINGPVLILRLFWFDLMRVRTFFGDCALLLLAIGTLWYWIGLCMESWWHRHELVLFKRVPLRMAANLLILAMGVLLGFVAADHWSYSFVQLLLISWSLLLTFFPGYDLIRTIRKRYFGLTANGLQAKS